MQNKVSISSFFEGKYTISECIKKNAFSGVYVVVNNSSEKILLKVILNNEANPEVIRRFKREAKILSKLKHKNIVKIIEYGFEREVSFIAFEYFESYNLREFLSKNEVSQETKYHLTSELFEGINYLHQNKIVHRDLKPENILVNQKNKLKITDFGLSLLLEDEFETKNQSIVGTPSYMSPEQIQGKRLTYKSDLFSIGSVVFEMFTSKNLFISDDFNKTINNIINFSISTLDNYEDELPHDIIRILKKLLVTELSKRATSIDDVIQILVIKNSTLNPSKKLIVNKFVVAVGSVIFAISVFYLFSTMFDAKNGVSNVFQSGKTATEQRDTLIQDNLVNTNLEVEEPLAVNKVIKPMQNGKDLRNNDEQTIIDKKNTIENAVTARLVKTKQIYIDTYPWSEIFLNDSSLGTTPLENEINLEYGTHTFAFVHPNFPVVKKNITVNDTTSNKYIFNLYKAFGYLNCKIFPWGTVFVDGIKIGETPMDNSLPLLPGNHLLEVENPSFPKYRKRIDIIKNDTTIVSLNLVKLAKQELK